MSVFREYDIRVSCRGELNETTVTKIGFAFSDIPWGHEDDDGVCA
ncbi:hypothetical protein WCX49_11570 [Sulfurimonas sp. HSL-1656]